MNRRHFLNRVAGLGLLACIGGSAGCAAPSPALKDPLFELSLSQWSLHRAIFGHSKEDYSAWIRALKTDPDSLWQGNLHPLDFPSRARALGFDAVEYVNACWFGHARDQTFLQELKRRTEGEGIRNLLIMCDEEGFLGHPDAVARTKVIENHYKWIEAAAFLGCYSVRVNAHSEGTYEEQKKLAADGLNRLAVYADTSGIDVIVENHGGLSSQPVWLVETIELANHPRLGTMVDFDNFAYSETRIWGGTERYNRYEGVELLTPHARSISAKSYAFDAEGHETTIDYRRMMRIILDAGFRGYVSVEYEGAELSEVDGIRATKALLERVRDELTPAYR